MPFDKVGAADHQQAGTAHFRHDFAAFFNFIYALTPSHQTSPKLPSRIRLWQRPRGAERLESMFKMPESSGR